MMNDTTTTMVRQMNILAKRCFQTLHTTRSVMDANDLSLLLTTLSTIKYCYEHIYSGPEVDQALDQAVERFLSVAERAKALAKDKDDLGLYEVSMIISQARGLLTQIEHHPLTCDDLKTRLAKHTVSVADYGLEHDLDLDA